MAMNGAPLSVNRCFAFGYFEPVNSKKADAGTRQRRLLSNRRPSDRKLKTGPPFGLAGGKPKPHRRQLDAISGRAHDRTEIVDPDIVRLREIALGLIGGRAQGERLHHLLILAPLHVLLVVVAHTPIRQALGPLLRESVVQASRNGEGKAFPCGRASSRPTPSAGVPATPRGRAYAITATPPGRGDTDERERAAAVAVTG